MASSYLLELQQRQQGLLDKLTGHLLPEVQPGSDNYALAHEFVSGNLNPKYHRFRDANGKDVTRIYEALESRLEEHSQLAKAARLHTLRVSLDGLQLEGEGPDTCAALLHLLFSLANRPLSSPLPEPSTAAGATAGEQAHKQHSAVSGTTADSQGLFAAGTSSREGKQEGIDYDDASSSSSSTSDWGNDASEDLSDWSDPGLTPDPRSHSSSGGGSEEKGDDAMEIDEQAADEQQEPAAAMGRAQEDSAAGQSNISGLPQRQQQHIAGGSTAGVHTHPSGTAQPPSAFGMFRPGLSVPSVALGKGDVPLSRTAAAAGQGGTCAGGLVPSRAVPCSTDLSARLAQVRLGATPFALPRPELCVTDSHLVHHSLGLLLTGQPSPCFVAAASGSNDANTGLSDSCSITSSNSAQHSTLGTARQSGAPVGGSTEYGAQTKNSSSAGWVPAPAFTPVAGLHTPSLSPGAVRGLLQQVADAGSQAAWLRHVAAAAESPAHAAAVPGTSGPPVLLTPCVRAFLQAAGQQLLTLQEPLVTLQQAGVTLQLSHFSSHSLSHKAPTTPLNLLQLWATIQGPLRRTSVLYEAVQGALKAVQATGVPAPEPSLGGSTTGEVTMESQRSDSVQQQDHGHAAEAAAAAAATTTACLMDHLAGRLQWLALQGSSPAARSAQQQTLHLALCAAAPMISSLQAWLFEGDTVVNYCGGGGGGSAASIADDFFVLSRPGIPTDTPQFWTHAFRMLLLQQPAAAAAPAQGPAAGAVQAQRGVTSSQAGSQGSAVAGSTKPKLSVDSLKDGKGAGVGAGAGPGSLACPQFLQSLGPDIYTAGKSVRVLRSAEEDEGGPLGDLTASSVLLPTVPGVLLATQPPTHGQFGHTSGYTSHQGGHTYVNAAAVPHNSSTRGLAQPPPQQHQGRPQTAGVTQTSGSQGLSGLTAEFSERVHTLFAHFLREQSTPEGHSQGAIVHQSHSAIPGTPHDSQDKEGAPVALSQLMARAGHGCSSTWPWVLTPESRSETGGSHTSAWVPPWAPRPGQLSALPWYLDQDNKSYFLQVIPGGAHGLQHQQGQGGSAKDAASGSGLGSAEHGLENQTCKGSSSPTTPLEAERVLAGHTCESHSPAGVTQQVTLSVNNSSPAGADTAAGGAQGGPVSGLGLAHSNNTPQDGGGAAQQRQGETRGGQAGQPPQQQKALSVDGDDDTGGVVPLEDWARSMSQVMCSAVVTTTVTAAAATPDARSSPGLASTATAAARKRLPFTGGGVASNNNTGSHQQHQQAQQQTFGSGGDINTPLEELLIASGAPILPSQPPQLLRKGLMSGGGGPLGRQLAWLISGEPHPLECPEWGQLMDVCLLQPLRLRVEDVGHAILGCLLSEWGLASELQALRNLYLLAAPAAQAWASHLVRGLLEGRPLHEHSELELEEGIQEACSAADLDPDNCRLPAPESLSVVLDKGRLREVRGRVAAALAASGVPAAETASQGLLSVSELDCLSLRCQPGRLLSMVGGEEAVNSYNNALVLVLQIKATRGAVDAARVRSWKAWQGHAALAGRLAGASRSDRPGVSGSIAGGIAGGTAHSRHLSMGGTAGGASGTFQRQASGPLGVTLTVTGHRPQGYSSSLFHQHLRSALGPAYVGLAGAPLPPAGTTSGTSRRGGSTSSAVHALSGGTSGAVHLLDARQEELALQEMSHFVTNLDLFVGERLLSCAWGELELELDEARSLDDAARAHRTFLSALDRQAGKAGVGQGGSGGTWKHLMTAVLKALDQALRFCHAQQAAIKHMQSALSLAGRTSTIADPRPLAQAQDNLLLARRQLASATQEFRRLHRYTMQFMRNNKATKIGGENGELSSLITRLDFNGYYTLPELGE